MISIDRPDDVVKDQPCSGAFDRFTDFKRLRTLARPGLFAFLR
jgi:hypothetical protein